MPVHNHIFSLPIIQDTIYNIKQVQNLTFTKGLSNASSLEYPVISAVLKFL